MWSTSIPIGLVSVELDLSSQRISGDSPSHRMTGTRVQTTTDAGPTLTNVFGVCCPSECGHTPGYLRSLPIPFASQPQVRCGQQPFQLQLTSILTPREKAPRKTFPSTTYDQLRISLFEAMDCVCPGCSGHKLFERTKASIF